MSESFRPPRFLERAELDSFAARARLDVHSGSTLEETGRDGFARSQSLVLRGLEGLRLAARLYALEDDEAALTPVVWGAWALERKVFELDLPTSLEDVLADAVTACGPRLSEIPGLAERLASASRAEVRRALATALPESARGILSVLADDVDPTVRKAACDRLGEDPSGRALPGPTEGHRERELEAARAVLMGSPYAVVGRPERAVRALARLDDMLAVACWERLLLLDVLHGKAIGAWSRALVLRRGGGDAFARVGRRWVGLGRPLLLDGAVKALLRLPKTTRRDVTSALLTALASGGSDVAQDDRPLAAAMVKLGASAADARRILESILGTTVDLAATTPAIAGYGGGFSARAALSELLGGLVVRGRLPRAERRALVDARRRDRPGRWAHVANEVYAALGADPVMRRRAWEELRALARADAPTADGRRRELVVAILEHRDPARDGTRASLVARLFTQPENRPVLIAFDDSAVRRATKELLRGALDARATAALLHRLERSAVPEDVRAASRAVRDRALEEGDADVVFGDVARWIAPGPSWDTSDLAFVRRALEAALDPAARRARIQGVVVAIASVHAPESDALLDEIRARANDAQKRMVESTVAWARDVG